MFFRLLTVLVAFGLGPASADPSFWRHEWPDTDFSVTSVASWTEIKSGGPPKDGIPALFDPQFIEAKDETAIDGRETVLTLALDGARTSPPDPLPDLAPLTTAR